MALRAEEPACLVFLPSAIHHTLLLYWQACCVGGMLRAVRICGYLPIELCRTRQADKRAAPVTRISRLTTIIGLVVILGCGGSGAEPTTPPTTGPSRPSIATFSATPSR